LKGQSGTKSPVKHNWNEKMTVLSKFLESSLNFLSNNLKGDFDFRKEPHLCFYEFHCFDAISIIMIQSN